MASVKAYMPAGWPSVVSAKTWVPFHSAARRCKEGWYVLSAAINTRRSSPSASSRSAGAISAASGTRHSTSPGSRRVRCKASRTCTYRGKVDDHNDPPRARLARSQDSAQQHREFAHARQKGEGRDLLGEDDGGVSVLRPISVVLDLAVLTPRRSGQHHRTDRAHCQPRRARGLCGSTPASVRRFQQLLLILQRACFHPRMFLYFPG